MEVLAVLCNTLSVLRHGLGLVEKKQILRTVGLIKFIIGIKFLIEHERSELDKGVTT